MVPTKTGVPTYPPPSSVNSFVPRFCCFVVSDGRRPPCAQFPHSDLAAAADRAHRSIDCRFGGPAAYWTTRFGDRPLVDSDEFRRALCADAALDEHAAAVLALAHKRPGPFEPHTELEFRSAVQDTLRKAQFVHFDGLRSNFASRKWIVDRGAAAGRLNRVQSAKAVKSSRLPLSVEIVRMLFDK